MLNDADRWPSRPPAELAAGRCQPSRPPAEPAAGRAGPEPAAGRADRRPSRPPAEPPAEPLAEPLAEPRAETGAAPLAESLAELSSSMQPLTYWFSKNSSLPTRCKSRVTDKMSFPVPANTPSLRTQNNTVSSLKKVQTEGNDSGA